MPSCVVRYCKNNSVAQKKLSGITFHKFPSEFDWKEKWVEVIRTNRIEERWSPTKFSVVCSAHFEEKDLFTTKSGLRRLVKNAVPKMLLDEFFNKDSEVVDQATNRLDEPNTGPVDEFQNVNLEHARDPVPTPSLDPLKYENDNQPIDNDEMSEMTDMTDWNLRCQLDTMSESKLRMQLRRHVKLITNCRKKIKILNQKVRRLNKRNVTLRNIVNKLTENTEICENSEDVD